MIFLVKYLLACFECLTIYFLKYIYFNGQPGVFLRLSFPWTFLLRPYNPSSLVFLLLIDIGMSVCCTTFSSSSLRARCFSTNPDIQASQPFLSISFITRLRKTTSSKNINSPCILLNTSIILLRTI